MKKHKNIFPLLFYLNTFYCEIVQVVESLSHRKIDGLMQERYNSIANTLEFCLSSTNSLK